MLRTSTIIFIVKIMVEVLKMSSLFWCFRATARMATATCHHTETFFNKVIRTRMPKVLVLLVPATGLIGFSREWRGIGLNLRDKIRGLDPTIVLCEFRL